MSGRKPGRVTRQILSGSELTPPRDSLAGQFPREESHSISFWYLVALSVLIVVSALIWAIWGMGAASPLLLILALGLVAAWLVL